MLIDAACADGYEYRQWDVCADANPTQVGVQSFETECILPYSAEFQLDAMSFPPVTTSSVHISVLTAHIAV